ncbi:hypothetical protein B8Z89_18710, partial [Klebsiella pneumoniae]
MILNIRFGSGAVGSSSRSGPQRISLTPESAEVKIIDPPSDVFVRTSASWSTKEGANKQVISSQADSLIKISRIWADF